ncbi:hypothetical protein Q4595_16020 [Wenyingzhuangia sp. 1_MG-2023]|nr:hypothetical protein [Wenyingzhuangia sp. 1_MG-2023]
MKNKVRNNKAKNTLLEYLKDYHFHSIRDFSKNKNIDLSFVCAEILEKSEYVKSMNTSYVDGDNLSLKISRKGSLFLKDGGYPSSGIKIIMKAIIDNKATIISIIALIISILTYLTKN